MMDLIWLYIIVYPINFLVESQEWCTPRWLEEIAGTYRSGSLLHYLIYIYTSHYMYTYKGWLDTIYSHDYVPTIHQVNALHVLNLIK